MSDKAKRAVLSQKQEDKERVIAIAYTSKRMNVYEQAFFILRKNLLAVVTAFRTFYAYVYGQEVILTSDNAAVSWMKILKKPTRQTAR